MRQRHLLLCMLLGLLFALLNACSQDNEDKTNVDGGGPPTTGNIQLVATFPEPVRLGTNAATSTTQATPSTITRLLLQVTEEDPPRILVPGSGDFRPCPDIPDDLNGLFCDILPGLQDDAFTFNIPSADVQRRFRLEAYEQGRTIPLFVGQATAVVRGRGPTPITINMQRDIPILGNPGKQIFAKGQQIRLQIESRAPTGAAFTFTATNLPPGVSIDSTSGIISGAIDPTAVENAYVITVEALVNGQVVHSITFSIDVPVTLAPEAANDLATTPSGTPVEVVVLDNDSDLDGTVQPETVAIQRPPDHGIAVNNPDGTITYTPVVGFRGTDRFTYTVADNEGAVSNEATVRITVENALPLANNDTALTPPNTAVTIPVLVNDGDMNADALEVTGIGTPPARGTATFTQAGKVIYTPPPGFMDTETFTYTIRDSPGGTAIATVTVTIDTETPRAAADQATTAVDTPVSIAVLANDLDPNGERLSVTAVTPPTRGTPNADGSVTYTPNPGFTGLDTFTYTVTDTTGNSATAVVLVRVGESGPQAVGDSAITSMDTPVRIAVLNNDSSPTQATLTLSRVTDGAHGTATINEAPGSAGNDVVEYAPALGFTGLDTFTYTIVDEQGRTARAAVTVRINGVPEAVPDAYIVREGDTLSVTRAAGVLANDTDADGDPLTAVLVTGPTHGTLTLSANGSFTYTHDGSETAQDSFRYQATDGLDNSRAATVTLTVTPVNDRPEADPQSVRTAEDTPVTLTLTGSDVETAPANLTFTIATPPAHGTLRGTPPAVTYTPAPDYNGDDRFTFTVTDRGDPDACGTPGADCAAALTSQPATVTLTVTPVNDRPEADAQSVRTAEDTSVALTLAGRDVETAPGNLTFTIATPPAHGTLSGTPPTVTYTPAPNFNGADRFTFTVTDRGDPDACGTPRAGCADVRTSAAATVTLTVTPVNDRPEVDAQSVRTAEDTSVALTLAGRDVETAPGNLTFTIATPPAHGTLSGTPPTVTYTPAPNFNGDDSFIFTVTDRGDPDACGTPGAGCAAALTSRPATVQLMVTPVNDRPVANAQDSGTPEDTPVALTLTGSDVETAPANLTFTIATPPADGTLSGTPPDVTYTPAPNFTGADRFTFTAMDRGDPDACGTPGVGCAVALTSRPATVTIDVRRGDVPMIDLNGSAPDDDYAIPFTEGDAPVRIVDQRDATITDPDSRTLVSLTVTLTNLLNPGQEELRVSDPDTLTPTTPISATYDPTTDPTQGVLTLSGPGTLAQYEAALRALTYQNTASPVLDVTARLITFVAEDRQGPGTTAITTVTMTPVNEQPEADPQSVRTAEDTPVTLTLSGSDPETAPGNLTFTIATPPAHGTLSGTPPTVTYTPAPNFNGADRFTFTVTDRGDPDACGTPGAGCADVRTSAAATVTITVTPVNDRPEVDAQSVRTAEDTPVTLTLSGSDVETAPANLMFTIATPPAHGTLSGTPPTVTYTPAPNFNGDDRFTFTVTDRGDPDACGTPRAGCADVRTSAAATVTLTVTPVNDRPEADSQSVRTAEDTPVALTLTGRDVETAPGNLTFIIATPPAHGTLSGTPPTVTYTPAPNFNGADRFTFTVTDRGDPDACGTPRAGCADVRTSAAATVTLTVTPVNDRPEVDAQSVRTAEDTSVALTLAGRDVETAPGNLTFTIATPPAHGTLSGTPPTVTYTPAPNFNGDDSFIFTVTDRGDPDACGTPGAGCAAALTSRPATVQLMVTPVNDRPVANAQDSGTPEDTPVALTLTGSDVETAPANLTFTIATPPADGTLSGTPPDVTYTPAPNFTGADRFTFTAMDRGDPDACGTPGVGCAVALTSRPATVTIDVRRGDVPMIDLNGSAPDDDYAIPFTEGDAPVRIVDQRDATITDPDSRTLVSLTVTLTNLLNPGQEELRVSDPDTLTPTTPISATYDPTTDPTQGVLTLSGPGTLAQYEAALRALTYQNTASPVLDVTARLITFVAEDRQGPGTTAITTVTMTPVNEQPEADPQSVRTAEDTPVTLTLSGSDPETAPGNLTFTIATPPAHGTLSGTPPTVTYTPAPNFNGADRFTFTVTDRGDPDACGTPGAGCADVRTSAAATVTITVTPVNDRPEVDAQSVRTAEDTPVTLTLSGSDVETAPANLMFTIATPPAHGTLSGPPPAVTYTPAPDYNGPDSFTFTVTDRGDPDACGTPGADCAAALTSQPAAVTLTVTPVNDRPVANAQDSGTAEDTPVALTLTGSDVETAPANLTFTIATPPAHGRLSGTPPDVTYTPNANYNGPDSFTFTVTDRGDPDACTASGASCDSPRTSPPATVQLTVAPGPAQLVFTGQPSDSVADIAINPAVVVEIQDEFGNLVTTATDPVTIAIATNPGIGTLSGTLTVSAVAGVATFSDLSIDRAGSGYTLEATLETVAGTLSAISNSFDITGLRITSFSSDKVLAQIGEVVNLSWTIRGRPTLVELEPGSIDVTGMTSTTVTPFPTVLNEADARAYFTIRATTPSITRENVDLVFASQAGGIESDGGLAITLLFDGSVVVTGQFKKAATFGKGELNETTFTTAADDDQDVDIFVARYAPDGTLTWARQVGVTDDQDAGFGITALSDGSVVVTGRLGFDIFVARYAPDGTLVWSRQLGDRFSDAGVGITTLPDNSVVVTGSFIGRVTFDAPSDLNKKTLTSTGIDIFLARYTSEGALIWACKIGGASADEGRGVAALPDGSVVVTGHVEGTVTFADDDNDPCDPNATELTAAAGRKDIFVARYAPHGTLTWARYDGGSDVDSGRGVAALPDGSVVVTGQFKAEVTFGEDEPNETTFPAAGEDDIFVARYAPDGTLTWVRHAGGTAITDDDEGYGVAALPDGSVVVTGHFAGEVTFGAGSPNATTFISAGSNDMFVARYAPNGTLTWARHDGGSSFDAGRGITTLPDGSVVVTGDFVGKAFFGTAPLNTKELDSDGKSDTFVARYIPENYRLLEIRPEGLAFAQQAGGATGFLDIGRGVAAFPDGSSVATGLFSGTATFQPGDILTAANDDILVVRYNPDGSFVWATQAGGANSDAGFGAAAFLDGSIVVSGLFRETAVFGLGEANETSLIAEGDPRIGAPDIFAARFNPDGTLAWARRGGGPDTDLFGDISFDVAAMLDGSAVITGTFRGTATFDGLCCTGGTLTLTAAGENDVFIARYDRDGFLLWVSQAGGASQAVGTSITALSDGSTMVTGRFSARATFGRGESNATTLSAVGDNDIFIARYNIDGTLDWARQAGGSLFDEGFGIDAFATGAVLVTGVFTGTATFGQGEPNETTLNTGGPEHIFVARYNPDGTLVWVREAAATRGGGVFIRVATFPDNSAVVTGSFTGSAIFGLGEANATTLTANGPEDIFIARYDADGTLIGVRQAGGSTDDAAFDVAAFPNGSAIVTGRFGETATFGPGEANAAILTAAGASDIFVMKYFPFAE